ncbi:MAG: YhjD/YihY/BrkB family envelope integrity protein [Acidimicrobiales bacterium]
MNLRRRVAVDQDRHVSLAHNITRHHTMLLMRRFAFSCVVGLIPALLAIVAVYGLVASPTDVESHLAAAPGARSPSRPAELLVDQLKNVTAISGAEVTLGLVIGLIGAAWAVSSAVNSMAMAIRIAHEMPSPHTWLQGRIFALKLSFVLIVAAASQIWLVVVLPPVLDRTDLGGASRTGLSLGRWPLVVVTSMAALAAVPIRGGEPAAGGSHAISVRVGERHRHLGAQHVPAGSGLRLHRHDRVHDRFARRRQR